MHMTVNIDRYIEDMEQWKKTREENEKLQQRIDKAIELLQDFDYLDKIDCFCEPTKVLNILRGEDK